MNENFIKLMALADELSAFILTSIAETQTVEKYGGTLFTLRPEEKEGQFCGVFVYKQHVQISFSKGAQLQDPQNLLLGSGKLRKHINYVSSELVDFAALKQLLVQAAAL